MATWDGPDGDILRLQEFNRAVKGIALRESIMKEMVTLSTVSSAKHTFFRETAAPLTATRGIGRWEPFPITEVTYEQVDAYVDKYGHECRISLEDLLMSNVPVFEQAIERLAHGVRIAVDQRIWSGLAFNFAAPTTTPTHGIRTLAAHSVWDNSTETDRRPWEDLLLAVDQIVSNDNQQYDPNTALVGPYDWARLMGNDNILANLSRAGADIQGTGRQKTISGLEIVRTNVVTDDYALVLQKKVCGTWVSPQGIQTAFKDEPGHGRYIRSFEFGVLEVTDPASICLITNTQT